MKRRRNRDWNGDFSDDPQFSEPEYFNCIPPGFQRVPGRAPTLKELVDLTPINPSPHLLVDGDALFLYICEKRSLKQEVCFALRSYFLFEDKGRTCDWGDQAGLLCFRLRPCWFLWVPLRILSFALPMLASLGAMMPLWISLYFSNFGWSLVYTPPLIAWHGSASKVSRRLDHVLPGIAKEASGQECHKTFQCWHPKQNQKCPWTRQLAV